MTSTLPAPQVITLPANQPDLRASRAAWVEHARILSTIVRRADLRDEVVQFGVPTLICTRRSWSKEVGEQAREEIAAGRFTDDMAGWEMALGIPESVELSEDGSYFETARWCECDETRAGEGSVYVERWAEVGRVFHGWVCKGCRRLSQSG